MKYTVSVVIPIFNEKKTISDTIERIHDYFHSQKVKFTIIAVDDGSTDDTLAVLRELELHYSTLMVIALPKNSWKGWAVRTGVMSAQGDLILTTDADLATPISEFQTLRKLLQKRKADVVIGSRIRVNGKDRRLTQPLLRRLLGKLFTGLRMVLISDLRDTQCGFKLFRKHAARALFSQQKIHNIIFDVEILYLAQKFNYTVFEAPVKWRHHTSNRMPATPVHALRTIWSLIMVWWYHRGRGRRAHLPKLPQNWYIPLNL